MMKKLIILTLLLIFTFEVWKWWQTIGAGDVSYIGDLINNQRRSCVVYFARPICFITYNKAIFYPILFTKNYLTAISFNYLFLQHPYYLLDLPVFLLGVYFLLREKNNYGKYTLWYFLIYPFFGPIFSLDWGTNYLIIKPLLLIVEIYGIIKLGEKFKKHHPWKTS